MGAPAKLNKSTKDAIYYMVENNRNKIPIKLYIYFKAFGETADNCETLVLTM